MPIPHLWRIDSRRKRPDRCRATNLPGCCRPKPSRSRLQPRYLIADIQNAVQVRPVISAAILLAAAASAPSCDLRAATTASAVHEALGRRAIEIVRLASTTDPEADHRLATYVDKAASFDLGAGDVGRPIGSGSVGARALAATMKADQFRFLGWDYMDSPSDGCGKQSVTVDFIDTAGHEISQVEFAFDRGMLISAKGWQHSFESGSLVANPSGS